MDRVLDICLHEASHAACCIKFCFKFDFVTVIPDDENSTLGCLHGGPKYHRPDFEFCDRLINGNVYQVRKVPRSDRLPLTSEQIEENIKNILMTLAGPAGEEFFYEYSIGAQSDYDTADYIIYCNSNMTLKIPDIQKLRFAYMEETRRMFGHKGSIEPLWPRTWEIGKVLWRKKTLTYDEVKAIYDAN